MELTAKEIQNWLVLFSETLEKNETYLNTLDTTNGNHGSNMMVSVNNYRENTQRYEPDTMYEVLRTMSGAMISSPGRAAKIYGIAFLGMANQVRDVERITSEKDLGVIVHAGLAGVKARSSEGNQAILDVWLPVVAALEKKTLTAKIIQQAGAKTDNLPVSDSDGDELASVSNHSVDSGTMSSVYLFQSLVEILK